MTEKINIEEITIDNLGITPENIHIITVAKVGTTNFSSTFLKSHTHGLNVLEDKIFNDKNKKLIISGIRNPIDRNISYFFETYCMKDCEPLLKINNYTPIQNTYVCDYDDIGQIDIFELIHAFKIKQYHNSFTQWFDEFFELTQINNIPFDKENGLQLYKIDEQNYILFYILEKLDSNINTINNFLNININNNYNSTLSKPVKDIYNKFKKNIILEKAYLDQLLNTEVIKYFYTDEEIKKMYNKYNTQK
jgi:hypothetical protein